MIIFNYGEWIGITAEMLEVSECSFEPFKYRCKLEDCSITKSTLELLLSSELDDFGNPVLDFITSNETTYVAWIEQPCIAFTLHGMLKLSEENLLRLNIAEDIKIPQDFLEYIGVNK